MNSGIGRSNAVDSLKDEALGESPQWGKEWLSAVLAASRDGIVIEANERIVEVSPSVVRLLGYESADELVGHSVSIFCSAPGEEKLPESNRQQSKNGLPGLFGLMAKRKDGTILQLEAAMNAATIAGNSCRIIVLRELTPRTNFEAQHLEAVGRLTKDFAHDLNNLLTAIRCQTELVLVYENVPHTVREMLQKVITVTDRATQLTSQLRAFVRLQPMQQHRDLEPASGRPTQEPRAIVGGNETLLVVADDRELRTLIRLTLQKLGYQVLEAASGVESLKTWASHAVDIRLILTEFLMPEEPAGYELIKRLRAEKSELKAIVMSGCAVDMPAVDLESLPGVRFLSKPFDPLSLAHMIRSCLDEKHESVHCG